MNKQHELIKIIDNLKNQKFDIALNKLKILSEKYSNDKTIIKLFASIYFKKKDWINSIEYYKKELIFEKEIYRIFTNIGVAYFNLGKIHKSIESFKKSINNNPNFDLSYSNLAIAYLEIGDFKNATDNFVSALNLNKNNYFAQNGLINIFTVSKPILTNSHPLIKINDKITNIINKNKIKDFNKLKNLKTILSESENIINNYNENIHFYETQIYKKNSINLNCKRHFKVFNKFNIIPKFCFSCYKIQLNLENVVDLIKLYFIFNNINLKKNNIRKCIVEMRNNIKGNYKGYIYCEGLQDAQDVFKKINLIINRKKFDNLKITIKHGCSEFYESYPEFEKINFAGEQEMHYEKDWQQIEKNIDIGYPLRQDIDKKVLGQSLSDLNLPNILIIKNWIKYAHVVGDYSYKLIYDKKINNNFMNNILKPQMDFRQKNA